MVGDPRFAAVGPWSEDAVDQSREQVERVEIQHNAVIESDQIGCSAVAKLNQIHTTSGRLLVISVNFSLISCRNWNGNEWLSGSFSVHPFAFGYHLIST